MLLRAAPPVLVAVLVLALAGAGSAGRPAPPGAGLPTMGGMDITDEVADQVASMSDGELAGQVLMPYFFGGHATRVAPAVARANREYAQVATPAELVARYHVGGVILLGHAEPGGAGNLASPARVRALTDGLRAAAGRPLLVGIDQEHGLISRLTDGVTRLPSPMAFGAAADPALTEAAWRAAGAELAAIGVNVNFAPVADVLDDAGQGRGVIGSRAFGSDPQLVAGQVVATVRGLRAAGVAATLKHFPGHGNTVVDSHEELPVVPASHPLARADLPPFTAGIEAGASLVMSGHLEVRPVEAGVPATFSHAVVTGLLRGELGFEGVAVTDALNMAPARRWSPGEAAVRALLAGNDLLLMPPDLAAAHGGLLAALADGTLPRERLVEAAARVLMLKQRLETSPVPDVSVLDSPAHHAAVEPATAASVTVLRGPCRGALVEEPVTVTASDGREHTRAALVRALAAAGVRVVDAGGSDPDGSAVHLVGYGDGAADLHDGAAVTVAMDTPYLLADADSPVLLATYSSGPGSMRALAAVLAGRAPAPGRSPVAVAGLPRSSCDG